MYDEQFICETVSEILSDFGYDVDSVKNVIEVVQRYREALTSENRYKLVILDLTNPGNIGGKESIERLSLIYPTIERNRFQRLLKGPNYRKR